MTGRRQYPRYVLTTPMDGVLTVREQVLVERSDNGDVHLLSGAPCRPGEQLALELPGDNREQTMTATECQPVVSVDGRICYRLRLAAQPVLSRTPAGGQQTS